MRADNSHHLTAATLRRSAATRKRALVLTATLCEEDRVSVAVNTWSGGEGTKR